MRKLQFPTNRTGENRTGEPRPLDWPLFVGTSVDAFVGRFVGVLEGVKKTGKSTLVGPVVGALVGPLVGPLVLPLVDPLVGRGSLSPALCVAHLGFCRALRVLRVSTGISEVVPGSDPMLVTACDLRELLKERLTIHTLLIKGANLQKNIQQVVSDSPPP